MNVDKAILAFLKGKEAQTPIRPIIGGGRGRTLYTDGNVLINYSTRIARLEGNDLFLNIKKYSQTTSKIQNNIRTEASYLGLNIIEVDGEV